MDAKKLVEAFGETVFDIIENEPEQLTKLEGIGKKRKEQIISAWAEQKAVRNVMVFLQSHGVGTARAVRIYKTYGDDAIEKVRENPYWLALDIYGIGFKTADALAQRLGIEKTALIRARAGVHYVLQELCDHGYCAAKMDKLVLTSHELLEIPISVIEDAIQKEMVEGDLIKDMINDEVCVYRAPLFHAETKSAERIKQLNIGCRLGESLTWRKRSLGLRKKTGLQLSDSQRHALAISLKSKLTIITGGPGVGKTTIGNSLIKIIRAKNRIVALCAPTGRAAKRLSETTGLTAMTIHRLLNFDPHHHEFNYNAANPLSIDVLVVDETSMLDIIIFNHLLKAIPEHAAVIFVGDIDQLPSVGPGAVLSDLIRSGTITTVRLTEIFRQAARSKIIINSHRINQGQMPFLSEEKGRDFYVIYRETPEEVLADLIEIVAQRLPNYCQCDPIKDIQILTPMNRGALGSRSLNIDLQKKLNGNAEPKVSRFGFTYSPGDKVIQMTNNYDKKVFNGDIGFIEKIDLEDGVIKIRFDQSIKEYDTSELDEIHLAYAISIHKSQGSEFPIVVLPLTMQHYPMLARNLLYTGITRGKKLVVLIGQKKAIGLAVPAIIKKLDV